MTFLLRKYRTSGEKIVQEDTGPNRVVNDDGTPLQPIVRLRFLLIDGREHLVALLMQIGGGSQWHFVSLGLNRPDDLSGNRTAAHRVLILLRSLTTASQFRRYHRWRDLEDGYSGEAELVAQ